MKNTSLLGAWIRRFLLEHMVSERNLAHNTQTSYRDALVVFLPFAAKQIGKSVDQLVIEDISADIIRRFLLHLEQQRGCSVSTRNQRLAAIHALARFIGERNPERIAWLTEIKSVPFKKTSKPSMAYLDKDEIDALLNTPKRDTQQGMRNHALLLFLYNSGARASEAAQLIIADLIFGNNPSVRLLGKGGKVRQCPLWPQTVSILSPLIDGRRLNEFVFLNHRKQPITRFGICCLVKRAAQAACLKLPALSNKRISTHSIRHSTAVHLLRSGVDINTIRAWLGHVSLDTTHVYAEVDLEMKAKALAKCQIPELPGDSAKPWSCNQELMAFLKSL